MYDRLLLISHIPVDDVEVNMCLFMLHFASHGIFPRTFSYSVISDRITLVLLLCCVVLCCAVLCCAVM